MVVCLKRITKTVPHKFCHNKPLNVLSAVSDLGVIIDYELKFTAHVNKISTRAMTRANLIHKCFLSKNRSSLLRAFKSFVRPVLEYNSPVWSPRLVKDIKRIESVQRRFTKRIPGLENIKYYERLKVLDLESLESRRIKADLILTYKILFGHIQLDVDRYFKFATLSTTRGHNYKLFLNRCCNSVRKHFFSYRVVPIWNSLPTTVNFSSLQ